MKRRTKRRPPDIRIGVHTSIAGGISNAVERAYALGCNSMQIFSHNPRQWAQSRIPVNEVERFIQLRSEYGISPVFIHTSYLINLAAGSDEILKKSIELLSYEMDNADRLGAEYVVLHAGSAGGDNERDARMRAVRAIRKSIGSVRCRARLLLENTAGERGDITSSMQAIAEIIDQCRTGNIGGICVDTCHAFAAGYDLREKNGVERLLGEIDNCTGIDKLKLIHLNDAKKPVGSGVDRHEQIGNGFIGIGGFRTFLSDKRVRSVPMILETPKENEDDDKKNLEKVFGILSKTDGSSPTSRSP
ncbi:putative endonuclease 4 [bacterium BMS3Abin07]|nr:putative endonuclease 4 [bacterium BMS3Abin07]HDO22851.1 deoxyribonuclease IV [Nitrospirota bacterium]HDZ87686.1 deoxyribonuclease IV [Nitrospirota bacterium]